MAKLLKGKVNKMYSVGVDLGGTNIAVGVLGEDNKIIGKASIPTKAERTAEAIFDDIATCVKKAVENAGLTIDDIQSIGIGTPGSVDKVKGYIDYANNLNFNKTPAKEMLESRLGKTVYLDNDANCAALGEAVAGAGNGVKDFIAITLGTGVGSGIIVDGKLLYGTNGAAAEMGHHVIKFDGVQCNCGRRGCWEQYASATALINQTKKAMENDKNSVMWELVNGDINAVNGVTAFDGMRKNDETATKVVKQYIDYISIGITNIVNIFQPDIICIGGGISHEGETLLKPIRDYVQKDRYSRYQMKQTKILAATLGNDAGIIGAALLKE